jgi:hypothetical protein
MKLQKLTKSNVRCTGGDKVVRVTRASLNIKSGLKAGIRKY